MQQRQLFFIFLRPSMFSAVATLLIGASLFGAAGWTYVSHNTMFYDYLYGQSGIATSVEHTIEPLTIQLDALLSQSWIYYVVIFVAAIAVGLLVYFVLQATSRVMFTVSETIEEVREGDEIARRILSKEILLRSAVRVIALTIWLAWLVLSLSVVLPFCIALLGVVIASFPDPAAWLQAAIASVVFFVTVHLHVLCIRAALLRPRVFGGNYLIMSTLD